MPELIVYGAPDCCLCDEAKDVITEIAPKLGVEVRHVDISGNRELECLHRTQIPVGYLDGRKVFKYRVDVELLRRRVRGS